MVVVVIVLYILHSKENKNHTKGKRVNSIEEYVIKIQIVTHEHLGYPSKQTGQSGWRFCGAGQMGANGF